MEMQFGFTIIFAFLALFLRALADNHSLSRGSEVGIVF